MRALNPYVKIMQQSRKGGAMQDRRKKRTRTRAAQKRQALQEQGK